MFLAQAAAQPCIPITVSTKTGPRNPAEKSSEGNKGALTYCNRYGSCCPNAVAVVGGDDDAKCFCLGKGRDRAMTAAWRGARPDRRSVIDRQTYRPNEIASSNRLHPIPSPSSPKVAHRSHTPFPAHLLPKWPIEATPRHTNGSLAISQMFLSGKGRDHQGNGGGWAQSST
jgi:hypothetical protein